MSVLKTPPPHSWERLGLPLHHDGTWHPLLPLLYFDPFLCVFLPIHLWPRSGTHGYMAPEVLQKGVAYDSSADWFSLGCMLFKLLRG